MTPNYASGGTDLHKAMSRSSNSNGRPRFVETGPTIANSLGEFVKRVVRYVNDVRRARALRREFESLSDSVLADLGIARREIPKHIRRFRCRQPSPRRQTVRGLSSHLLNDLAIHLPQRETRPYISVPLGVVSVYGVPVRRGSPGARERTS
jgi:uncharacterized protein YjiS (DUF1127 family)